MLGEKWIFLMGMVGFWTGSCGLDCNGGLNETFFGDSEGLRKHGVILKLGYPKVSWFPIILPRIEMSILGSFIFRHHMEMFM